MKPKFKKKTTTTHKNELQFNCKLNKEIKNCVNKPK